MKKMRTLYILLVGVTAASPLAAYAAWQGASATAPSSNVAGPVWLQTGTPTQQAGSYSVSGYTRVGTTNGGTTNGDMSLGGDVYFTSSARSIRVDSNGAAVLNFGNYDGGTGDTLEVNFLRGSSPSEQQVRIIASDTAGAGQICLNGTCISDWNDAGGGVTDDWVDETGDTMTGDLTIQNGGDAFLNITADTNDSGESDNARIFFSQDGGASTGWVGLEGTSGQAAGDSVSNSMLVYSEAAPVQLATAGIVHLTVETSGSVGVGTNNPINTAKLHALADSDDTIAAVYGENPDYTGVYGEGGEYGVYGYGGYGVWGANSISDTNGWIGSVDYGVFGRYDNPGNYGALGSASYGAEGHHNASGNYGYLGTQSFGVQGFGFGSDGGVSGVHQTSGHYGVLGTTNYGVMSVGGSGIYVDVGSNDLRLGGLGEGSCAGYSGIAVGDTIESTSTCDPFVIRTNGSTAEFAAGSNSVVLEGDEIRFYAAGGYRVSIGDYTMYFDDRPGSSGGNVALCMDSSGASYLGTCTSSIRFKQDVKDLTLGLEEILQLRPRTFAWKSDPNGRREVGFIAEEVEKIAPILVQYEEDGVTPSGLSYDGVTVMLTNAVQELKKENDGLRAELEDLRGRVERLEKGE